MDAKDRIKIYAEKRAEKFNFKHKLQTFKVGELVLLKALNVGRKRIIPVSYTHLDVYKRQLSYLFI